MTEIQDFNPTNTCINCGDDIRFGEDFCEKCGQKSDTTRIDNHFLVHNIVHTLTHCDKGIVHLIKEMTFRPGLVVKEYVQGKRKKYFNPFNFIFITITISALLTNSLDLMITTENPNQISRVIQKNFNIILMLGLPILAFTTKLLFRKKKYNFAENLVFHCFTSGYRVFFFIFLFAAVVPFFREHYFTILYSYLGLFLIYLTWAAYQFFEEKLIWTILKTVLSLVITQFIISAVIFSSIAIYYSLL